MRLLNGPPSRIMILVLLYAASAIAPSIHQLVDHAETDCPACLANANQATIAALCEGPCSDPNHHHHPTSNHRDCLICRVARNLFAAPIPPCSVASVEYTAFQAPPSLTVHFEIGGITNHAPRAPPRFRIL